MGKTKPKIHYAWWILIGCCFLEAGSLGGILDAAGVFFVPVCEDLGFTRSEFSFYLTLYSLATVISMPFVGRWIPKFNINILLSIMFGLVLIAFAAMSFYTEPWQWWISGVIFGLAGAFIFVMPAPILINNWFKKRRGMALGIGMSFSGIGGAILSPVFASVIEAVGWRTGYLVAAVIIGLLVLPFTMFVFKYKPEDMGLKPYGWTEEDERIAEGLKRTKRAIPGVPVSRAVKSIPFICMFLFAGLIAYFGGFNAHLPGFGTSIGFSPVVASTLITAVMIGNVCEKLLVGYLNDKIGVQFTVNIQLLMVALGFMGFILAGDNLMLLYISAFLFGAQNSLVSVSTPLLIRQLFGNKDFVPLFAYARVGTGLIGALGPVTIGALYDVTGTFIPTFVLGIGIVVAGFAVTRIAYMLRKRLVWEDIPDDPVEADKIRNCKTASAL